MIVENEISTPAREARDPWWLVETIAQLIWKAVMRWALVRVNVEKVEAKEGLNIITDQSWVTNMT